MWAQWYTRPPAYGCGGGSLDHRTPAGAGAGEWGRAGAERSRAGVVKIACHGVTDRPCTPVTAPHLTGFGVQGWAAFRSGQAGAGVAKAVPVFPFASLDRLLMWGGYFLPPYIRLGAVAERPMCESGQAKKAPDLSVRRLFALLVLEVISGDVCGRILRSRR
jgi:hypothetical protein